MKSSPNLWKNLMWAVATLLITAYVFSLLFQTQTKPEQLSVSQVVEKINAGDISKITVAGDTLNIELRDGKKAVSQKEAEAGITETLKNFGVDQEKLKSVSVGVQDESGFAYWAKVLIPTLLPLIIIGVFFWMIFRQAKTGA